MRVTLPGVYSWHYKLTNSLSGMLQYTKALGDNVIWIHNIMYTETMNQHTLSQQWRNYTSPKNNG